MRPARTAIATATGGIESVRIVAADCIFVIRVCHAEENMRGVDTRPSTTDWRAATVLAAGSPLARSHFHGAICIAATLSAARFTTSALPTNRAARRLARHTSQP